MSAVRDVVLDVYAGLKSNIDNGTFDDARVDNVQLVDECLRIDVTVKKNNPTEFITIPIIIPKSETS